MPSQLVLLIGLAALFVGVVGAVALLGGMVAERQQINRSLAVIRELRTTPSGRNQELDRPFSERVLDPAVGRLSRLGKMLTAGDQATRIRQKLDVAGNPPRWSVDRVLAFKMLGLFGGGLLGLVIPILFGAGWLTVAGFFVVLAALGYFAPNLVLYQMSYNRTDRIRRELPDALDLLTISVEAGLAFDASLSQVARNTTGPLAEEFFRVLQEMQIGLGRSEAFRGLGERTDLPELRSFVTAIVQADAFGIPIANVLRVQAKEMRVKRTQRAEELAQKVPVKILFPLIFCILPALFVVVLGPAVIQILESFSGGL